MIIDGKTKLLGLMGGEIPYTLSPAIHNCFIEKLSMNLVYVPFNFVNINHVSPFLNFMWDAGAVGFNVTQPLKEVIGKLIPSNTRSINTIYRGSKGWLGSSTDAEGLSNALGHLGIALENFKNIVILGNGGVAVGIVEYLSRQSKVPIHIDVLRRNSQRDAQIQELESNGLTIAFLDFDGSSLTRCIRGRGRDTLLIQATSAVNKGDPLLAFGDCLNEFDGYVVDLAYDSSSEILRRAKDRNLPHQDGIPMLIEQARLSQMYWFNQQDTYESVERAIDCARRTNTARAAF